MSSKAPSEGTKVTAGKNAPTIHEAPGAVAADSLAAESQAFQQANKAEPQSLPHENLTTTTSKSHSGSAAGKSSGTSTSTSQAGTAPSYVQNLYHQDPKGPHGKNLKEDESIATEDRNKNASFSEFGTKNDPGAAAERKFQLADSVPAGSSGARETRGDGKTAFDVLGSEREA
ncbi:hypothetical protein F5B20DRAFT_584024 [Whalleya microplaca]|nr:hypothetical protein F5B20DRAFT_584024 [Whalleya microplaca]